jgi:hypothetical protein
MLTPDQSKLRIADAEIARLKKDNDRLRKKLVDVVAGGCAIVELVFQNYPFLRVKLGGDLDELKKMKAEDF